VALNARITVSAVASDFFVGGKKVVTRSDALFAHFTSAKLRLAKQKRNRLSETPKKKEKKEK
jgi:hypothetical protein